MTFVPIVDVSWLDPVARRGAPQQSRNASADAASETIQGDARESGCVAVALWPNPVS